MPSAKRNAVDWAVTEKGYSQRRACCLVGMDRKSFRYASKRPDDGDIRTSHTVQSTLTMETN